MITPVFAPKCGNAFALNAASEKTSSIGKEVKE